VAAAESYVSKGQAETSVLFELIGNRYERLSLLITANQPFGEWGKVFPDQAMTLAAIGRLVHHATILEMNVESYRQPIASAAPDGRQRTRQSRKEPDCRSATISRVASDNQKRGDKKSLRSARINTIITSLLAAASHSERR
jgi:hypothetical protein